MSACQNNIWQATGQVGFGLALEKFSHRDLTRYTAVKK